jgi:hypothetical protein
MSSQARLHKTSFFLASTAKQERRVVAIVAPRHPALVPTRRSNRDAVARH